MQIYVVILLAPFIVTGFIGFLVWRGLCGGAKAADDFLIYLKARQVFYDEQNQKRTD